MPIHLVEKEDRFVKIENKMWQSGLWPVAEEDAMNLVGEKIYFHRKKSEPSFYGGTIRSIRVEEEEPHRGSVFFEFDYGADTRGVKTDSKGWTGDVKIEKRQADE